MPSRAIKVLSVSDRTDTSLFDNDAYELYKDVDLILSCGDLPYYHLEKLFELYEVPLLYVRGNHDPRVEYGKSGPSYGPRGGMDLHSRVVELNGLIFAGFEGSLPYKEGPFLYSQSEMWRFVLSIVPRLIWNRLAHGRFLDVVITHSPPAGIHDLDSNVHGGYQAFRWLIKTFRPGYFFHGHIHVYGEEQEVESIAGRTKVINTYGHRKTLIRPGQRFYPVRERPYFPNQSNSAEDFRDARRQAALEQIWSSLTGSSSQLLGFEQVQEQLQYEKSRKLGLKDIPLDAIVGSVSRPSDFTRKFFPRDPVDPTRWQSAKQGMDRGIRPIEVYQIDQVYFVLDGNHRVSVARQRGMTHLPAYVTKIETAVPLTPGDDYEDMIIKNQQVRFRKDTGLAEIRPDLEFATTIPGGYQRLREQILSHQMSLELRHHYPYSFEEAAESWVEEVYLPLLQTVAQSGLLRDFPQRTPTDLYVWLNQYRDELSKQYGWEIPPSAAVDSLAAAYGQRLARRWKRWTQRLFPGAVPQSGGIGDWRRTHLAPRREGRIFTAILVAFNGQEGGWKALKQSLKIAAREDGRVAALQVLPPSQGAPPPHPASLEADILKLGREYQLEPRLHTEEGDVVELLTKRALWNDLLVFSLDHPPDNRPGSRLRSGVRSLVQNCPRPLLAVPAVSEMKHGLLAFDGSPKATEALYLAAYLVENWDIQLSVVSARDDSTNRSDPLEQARSYLAARSIPARFISELGLPEQVILAVQQERGCDFLIAGGYGYRPVIELLLGSTLDTLLRRSQVPILICH